MFAAYLLMPEGSFAKEWAQSRGLALYDQVLKLKRIYRVSYRTVLFRMSESGVADVWPRFMLKRDVARVAPCSESDVAGGSAR